MIASAIDRSFLFDLRHMEGKGNQDRFLEESFFPFQHLIKKKKEHVLEQGNASSMKKWDLDFLFIKAGS